MALYPSLSISSRIFTPEYDPSGRFQAGAARARVVPLAIWVDMFFKKAVRSILASCWSCLSLISAGGAERGCPR